MRRVSLTILALLLSVAGVIVPRLARAQQQPLCFPDVPGISNCIQGRFRDYWQQNGGLPVFGYPITPATEEQTAEGTFLTQYFERNRFEFHPEQQAPYDVLLGRLGDDRLKQLGRDWQTFPKATPSAAHYFAETGHAIATEVFWQYWSTHGLQDPALTPAGRSLALFGLPLSEAMMETNTSGDTVLTQWFERARLECHPNNPPASQVLLGLLGSEVRTNPLLPTAKPAVACTVTVAPPAPVAPAPQPTAQPAPPPPAPTTRPAPPPPANPPAPNCDPSYPDFCIPPPPPDLDCPDIPRKNFRVIGRDPHRFDGDNDGIGCER